MTSTHENLTSTHNNVRTNTTKHQKYTQDGTSWSRYLTSRLIPSHKDPPEDQLRAFPGLASVPPAELELLRAKLPPMDDESYREFFWDVCDPNFQ